ncbi:MAG: PEP-CTERM sorting domain-containing protein [Akkermansia sp.]|nr:PEP-CTERM sorting domain-containing protein [Akkermansia sp.]
MKSSHYTTSFGSGTSSLNLIQTKGKMEVYGFSIAKSGLSITQTGGTILLRDVLNLSGEDENVITQGQVDDATKAELTVGQFTGQTATITMNQTGKGTINLAYGSSFTKDGTINVNQTGAGEINIGGGHKEGVSTTNTYDTVFPGFVAENTTYNIKQTGSGTVHIKSNAAITTDTVNVGTNATLNVDGSIIIKGTATLNGTVNVGATATFELAESCNMSVSTELELSSGNSIRFGIGSVSDADGSMQMSTTGDLAFAGGELELWLTDDALWEMAEGADALGSEYHLTLISNLSEADMLELDSVINDELVLSRYYKELELPTTYDVNSALPITIEANSLILENNALKAIAIATNPNLTVPEPTTATLSLLALVGLASRRRRK